jgi:hypothetical protein
MIAEMILGSKPSFNDYRTQRSAYMTPDRGFVKQLKKLHKEFEVVWDWGSNKWEIWQCPKGKKGNHVLTVETKGKTYRELGADILLNLQQTLAWQHMSAKQICDYLDEMDNQERRRKAKEFKNKIDSITNETFDYARGVIKMQVPRCFSLGRMVSNERSGEISLK